MSDNYSKGLPELLNLGSKDLHILENLVPLYFVFYSAPRFVTHIDDSAIAALTKYYSKVLPPSNTPGVCLLDMCSSWVSHYPPGYKQDRIVGMGMNEDELKRNPVIVISFLGLRTCIEEVNDLGKQMDKFEESLGVKMKAMEMKVCAIEEKLKSMEEKLKEMKSWMKIAKEHSMGAFLCICA
ncbi:hypothetical protein QJS10_CPA06g01010 [Acorus calamus]|uniref:Uncharacterized protein n=1 Tax=Acorus calamus TaxID=4465 RepID=A0AAV9EQX6_ACOCL|nr:hypothetical protein QJS10_CPA06g01010 [Acorus calamus]